MKKNILLSIAFCLSFLLTGTISISAQTTGYYQPAPPPSPFSICNPDSPLYPNNCGRSPVNPNPANPANPVVPVINQNQPGYPTNPYCIPVVEQKPVPIPIIEQNQPNYPANPYGVGQNQPGYPTNSYGVPVISQNQPQTFLQAQSNGTYNLIWTITNTSGKAWPSSDIDIKCVGGQNYLTNPGVTRWDIPYSVYANGSLTFSVNIYPPTPGINMTFSIMDGGSTVFTFAVIL